MEWVTSKCMGEMSHEGTCLLGAWIHFSFYFCSAAPSILSRSRLTLRSPPRLPHPGPLLIPFPVPLTGAMGAGLVISCSQLGLLVFLLLLPSLLILRATFYPLEECSTDEGYMLSDSVVQDLGSSVQMYRIPKEMGGIQVTQSPAPKRLDNFCPKLFHRRCQPAFITLIITVAHILQGVSILNDCMLLCG